MPLVTEHSIKIKAELPKIVSQEMEVFYNPLMISNRNISITLLNSIENTEMNIADPLAGSGIRSLRFLKELKKGKIKHLYVNDMNEVFLKAFQDNAKLNKVKLNKNQVSLFNKEANLFMQEQIGFDYIEIDPFGSPNPFLAAAVARISREGIIAITATDTAALTGTYPSVTKRKYWATTSKNYLMHELGLRILIRKIQLQGVQFDKALIPVLAYHKDHYFRVYVQNQKGKDNCDDLLKQHQYFLFCPKCLNFKTSIYNKEKCKCGTEFNFHGPLWIGRLFDNNLLQKMVSENPFVEEQHFLDLLLEESSSSQVGFVDVHEVARIQKKNPPRMEDALKKYKGVRTHFTVHGIKV
ncbi:MAG: hypothetical protein WCV90_03530 [Candidatus Woesearchaeota archaeon]|jgi:tRNA (guanine26-N2/guanine27-N2)-dimethyltransferase